MTFAAKHCVVKRDLAQKTLEILKNGGGDLQYAMNQDLDNITLDWASGYFDVRGVVVQPVPATETTKKKRGNVKVVLPKAERFVLPALQRVLHGRVKKNSPCRLVYDTKDTIKQFLSTVDGHVRAKKDDLLTVL